MDKQIREENKKARPKFMFTLLAAGFLGGMLSVLWGFAQDRGVGENFLPWLESAIQLALPWFIPVILALVIPVHMITMGKVKTMKAAWNGEDEEIPETIDRKIDSLLILQNVALGLVYLSFSAGTVYRKELIVDFVVLAEMIAGIFCVFCMQKQTIEFVRSMNPEKKGSVYDMKFSKVWSESCDEAEKMRMGQAAYGVFETMTRVCIAVWAVLIFLQMFVGVGLLPSVVVIGLFAVSQICYWFEIRKLSRHRA